jgi:GNAT superfamily N-acetyltransferase
MGNEFDERISSREETVISQTYSPYRMTISQATLKDVEALSILFDEYRMFYTCASNLSAGKAFLTERIVNSDSVIYMAESDEGVVMGFTQLYPLFSSTRMKKLWLLNDLYVKPIFRGINLSVQLIERAKRLARETQAVGLILETAKSNTIGNNLYPKTGFVLDDDHNYYAWTC